MFIYKEKSESRVNGYLFQTQSTKGSLKIKGVSWRTALNRTDSVRQMFKEAKDGKKYQLNFPSELDEQN